MQGGGRRKEEEVGRRRADGRWKDGKEGRRTGRFVPMRMTRRSRNAAGPREVL